MSENSNDQLHPVIITPRKPEMRAPSINSSGIISDYKEPQENDHQQKEQKEVCSNIKNNNNSSSRWASAAVDKSTHYSGVALIRRQMQDRQQQQQQQQYQLQSNIPSSRVCNVLFPSCPEFPGTKNNSLLNGRKSSPLVWNSPGDDVNDINNNNTSFPIGGVVPQETLLQLPTAITPNTSSEYDHKLFKQSGRHIPRPEALVVHPQGFRILKNRSVMERSLRSYFRLPPAPSTHLKKERVRVQKQLLAVDMIEDAEEARFFGAAVYGGPLRQPQVAKTTMQPRMILDGFLLLCAGGQPEPEAVESVTLQSSHLIGVIEEDLRHFQNLKFLDVSENELLLEHLLPLTNLEILHLAYNKIKSLAGVEKAVQEQQIQETNNATGGMNSIYASRSGEGLGHTTGRDSASIRSAAAYYAQENSTTTTTTTANKANFHSRDDIQCHTPIERITKNIINMENSNLCSSYFSPHQKPIRRPPQASECSLHDVVLPSLHALNLSFNSIPPGDILHLSYFPFLEKLDLSGNNLRKLPEDLAALTSVTHLALERNHFRDGNNIFSALSTMPALIEVNLNHNELKNVPPLSVKDGHGLCFPTIEVIGLGYNRVTNVQDIASLSELVRTLQRVVLAGNPIARKQKEKSATQAYFAQAVMNLYWEQAGLRNNGHSGDIGSTSHFYTSTLQENSLKHQKHDDHHQHYKKKNKNNKEEYEEEFNNEDDNKLELEEEEYHGWSSLIGSWQLQPNSESESKKASQQRDVEFYEGDNISVNNNNNNEESTEGYYDDNEGFTEKLSSAGQNISLFPKSTDDSSMINNIFWYGDAIPPPMQTTETGGYPTFTTLPSPSLLRFVEIVFDDTIMEKQKPGYFYAKKREFTAEINNGGQQIIHNQTSQGETGHHTSSSWMVHPKTGLVTIPKYSEFMNIYKIIDNPTKRRGKNGKRKYNVTKQNNNQRKRMEDIILPEEEESEKEEENDKKKTTTEVKSTEPLTKKEEKLEEEEENLEEEEEEYESLSESVSSRDVVFMTGVALEERNTPEKRKKRNKSQHEKKEEKESLHQNSTNIKLEKIHIKKDKKQTKEQNSPLNSNQKCKNKSSIVNEPPSTNVRILMNELRRMLRRPLPPLPPVTTRNSNNRNVK